MNEPQRPLDLAALQGSSTRRWYQTRLLHWGGVALVALVALALYLLPGSRSAPAMAYRTIEARTGSLVVTVTTTGTLQPVNRVDIGSELSGTIASVEVDFNDHVEEGTVLARLDTEILEARIAEAKASLQSAKARIAEASATVTETNVNLQRCLALLKQQMCSRSERDTMKAAYLRAQANETVAKSQLEMAQAALTLEQTNLRKAVIRSPISGVVLDRKVEPGQTVAASFQTPVLFTIAEDLKRMELSVAVDEADVGQVRTGQSASFTVDAFPRRTFSAKVVQIRQAPKTVEGVVTYETVLEVDNSELLLMPGMTATAQIIVNQIDNALLVPNAALRFTPPETPSSKGFSFSLFPRRSPTAQKPRAVGRERTAQVWIERERVPVAIPITTGATDGQWTEVSEGAVKAGDALLVDVVSSAK
ncbi:MAG TPA: efflux RND transporter periplasmic adaptor subunit [Gammaproteobacteria bacterium]